MVNTRIVQVVNEKSGQPLKNVFVHLRYNSSFWRPYKEPFSGCISPDMIVKSNNKGFFEIPPPNLPKKTLQRIARNESDHVFVVATLLKPGYLAYDTTSIDHIKRFTFDYENPDSQLFMKPQALNAIQKMDYYAWVYIYFSNNCGNPPSELNLAIVPLMRKIVDDFYKNWRLMILDQGKQPEQQQTRGHFLRQIDYKREVVPEK